MSTAYQQLADHAAEDVHLPEADTVQEDVDDIYDRLSGTTERTDERVDLRDLDTYTIDPHDAKDFDDAVSVAKEYDDGQLSGYRAWVHIADVPHYIDEDSAVDDIMQQQGFTVYSPDPVTHLLPAGLADELSLVERRDRRANTIELQFDADGALDTYDIYRSIVSTDRNLSYDQANTYVTIPGGSPALGDQGKELVHDLEDLAFLSQRLASRADRGHMDRTTAYRIVEEFMLTANELGAQELQQDGNGIYRVHDGIHEKARYTPHSDVHVGLDTEPYAHFTSPIRRYGDIINWRLYWDEFDGNTNDLAVIADHLNRRETAIEQEDASFDGIDVVGRDH